MPRHSAAALSETDLPPDLVHAVVKNAEEEAELVQKVLMELDFRGYSPKRQLFLPRNFLLELGSALRLLQWESGGIRVHLDTGLPSGLEAVRNAGYWLKAAVGLAEGPPPTLISSYVLARYIQHFAWSGQAELNIDLALGESDEDAVLEALADLLWAKQVSINSDQEPS